MAATVVKNELLPETVERVTGFITNCGGVPGVPAKYEGEGFSSDLIRNLLKVQHIHRGRVTCILTVKPYVCNAYNTFHGGAVGSIAEMVGIACARTVVNKDKELFLGELSVSYLAAAVSQHSRLDDVGSRVTTYYKAEVIVDASVVRSGRNLTVVAIEFKLKDSERLNYLCRATFFNMPIASL